MALGGKRLQFVGEGAFEAEQVSALDVREDVLGVGGVAAVGVGER